MTDTTERADTQASTIELGYWLLGKASRREVIEKSIEALRQTWMDCSGEDAAPSPEILRFLMTEHNPDTLDRALAITANKVLLGHVRGDTDAWYYYLQGVLRNLVKDRSYRHRPALLTDDDLEEDEE